MAERGGARRGPADVPRSGDTARRRDLTALGQRLFALCAGRVVRVRGQAAAARAGLPDALRGRLRHGLGGGGAAPNTESEIAGPRRLLWHHGQLPDGAAVAVRGASHLEEVAGPAAPVRPASLGPLRAAGATVPVATATGGPLGVPSGSEAM